MNSWMTEERRQIAQKYVHDMINSFVEDPHRANYHEECYSPYVSFYSPDIERLLEKACHNDKYSVKHLEFDMLHGVDNRLYDIDSHRVWTISGTVHIDIDGVAFDRNECKWLERTPGGGRVSTSSGCIANPGSTSIKYDCQSKFGSLFSLWLSQWEELRSA